MDLNVGDGRNGAEGGSGPEEPETIPKEKKECWFWINRKCKFGDRCRDNHTELCKEFLEWGECKIENCTIKHPIVCKYLYENKYCRNMKECRFRHPNRIRNKYEYEYKSEYNHRRLNENNHNYNQQQGMAPNRQRNQHNNNNQWEQENWNNYNDYRNQQNNGHKDPRNTENFHYGEHQWPSIREADNQMKRMILNITDEVKNRVMNR